MNGSERTDTVLMYTTPTCGDCRITKQALEAMRVPYREVDVTRDPDAEAFVLRVNDGRRSVPTLAYGDHAASLSNFNKRRLDAFLAEAGVPRAGH